MTERFELPKGVTVIEDFGWGNCKRCGEWKDLRFGVCFHCATEQEKRRDLELIGIKKDDEAEERQRLINSRPDLSPPKHRRRKNSNQIRG